MALDYTGTDDGIFRHIGKLIKFFNEYLATATGPSDGLDANRDEILAAFIAGKRAVAVAGLTDSYERWKREIVDRRATLANHVFARLTDPPTVLTPIGAVSTDRNEVLSKLIAQMIVDSATVNESSVVIGSVTAGASNTGNGEVFITDILDGYSSPGSASGLQYPTDLAYLGLVTQLAQPDETMSLRCIDNGAFFGSAVLVWEGNYPDPDGQYGLGPEGSGSIGSVVEAHQNVTSYLVNPDFESFTNPNEPNDWTIVSGTPGTHIKDNSNLTYVAHGLKSLQLEGDGSLASIELSQVVAADSVNSQRRYLVSAQIKADASITNGTLSIEFAGTGYTPGGGEGISIAPGSLPTNFELHHFFVTIPPTIPANFRLVLKWSGTPTNAKSVYLDDLGMTPVTYGGGIGVAAVRGTDPFAVGDKFSFTIENTEGVFQSAFRRMFGVQLPSSSTPTIDDNLAQ